jgi:hypothetical protein
VGVSRPRNGLENGAPENLALYANLLPQFVGIGWCSSLSLPGLSSRSTSFHVVILAWKVVESAKQP